MKTNSIKRRSAGYVSFLMVAAMGATLLVMMVFSYKAAVRVHAVQAGVQLQVDYAEKEDAVLRALVAITPKRAIRAMQQGSNASATNRDALSWNTIFSDALVLANARQSISAELKTAMGAGGAIDGNVGDAGLGDVSQIVKAATSETGLISSGLNRSLGAGYPVPLSDNNLTEVARDRSWPIISNRKVYGSLAQTGVALPVETYPNMNLITYPNLNFGYALPGQPFVAKRNWWAFSLDLSAADAAATRAVTSKRDFVLSIYEIPSQLAISASSFMALGAHEDGEAWQHTTIDGGVYLDKAMVEGETALSAIATRRGADLSSGSTVGGLGFTGDPMAPGLREQYQLTQGDYFFPVSMPSESGRAAFVGINRGADFLDRLSHSPETSVLSSTAWNDYSVGALQCAMQLDVTEVVSSSNKTPTELRFSYLKGGVRKNLDISLTTGAGTGLPAGYLYACPEYSTYNFGSTVVDVAYGKNGVYAFQTGVSGSVYFDNSRFGDPLVGVVKVGYFRPSFPFEIKTMQSGKLCVAVYPQRMPAFLTALGADSPAVNHSLVVNVDYTTATGSNLLAKPSIPCTELDYGLILLECANLSPFTKGFSLVTNLRLYYGDDFNTVATAPPTGFTPANGVFYPPCSVFAPEKRFGVDDDPLAVDMLGQLGSLASTDAGSPTRPLDMVKGSGLDVDQERIVVNLKPITHPAELPPINMMNWLVVVEERREEFKAN
ncbi:MAG: hypothetical protein K9N23_23265 [Akkermansiaceae bacterium]|nr:hypothetical protein [Akkermansiaceae bacterium]